MRFFLLTFFLLYGSGHLYLLYKVRVGYGLGRRATWLLSLWSLLMVTAPALVHWLQRPGFDVLARWLTYLAYGWLGWLFYFVAIALLLDVLSFSARLLTRFRGGNIPGRRPSRLLILLPLLLSFFVVGYGFFEARAIRLERVVLPTTKLPPGVERLKIVQLSDLHLGLLVGRERLATVVEIVRRAEPDILVATGDLLDGQVDNPMELADQLRAIRTTYGKFAILGNHEFYTGLQYSQAFLAQAGFVVLRNAAQVVAGGVVVAGVDDRRLSTLPLNAVGGEAQLLAGLGGDHRFVLLLKHRPRVEPASLGHFDLQLSGHLHQGQIFPFGLVVRWFYPVPVGVLHALDQGYLYVSRGAGTWGPPIRVLAPPQVTLIELVATPTAAR